jgi:hypothetical protein
MQSVGISTDYSFKHGGMAKEEDITITCMKVLIVETSEIAKNVVQYLRQETMCIK